METTDTNTDFNILFIISFPNSDQIVQSSNYDVTLNPSTGTIRANAFTGNVTGNVSGNAGTVTNGVYTTGDQSIADTKTFTSTISGSIDGNAASVTNGVYTTGDQTIQGIKTFSSTVNTGNAMSITANSLTTGTGLDLSLIHI